MMLNVIKLLWSVNLILSLAIEKKLGFTKVVTKLIMSKKQNEPIIPLFTYHSGKFLLSKKNSDTKKCQRAVMLNWSQFHKFYCDWGKECLFMYCDCVNVFLWKDKTLFLFAFRLVLQWLPLKLLEVVCLLFTNKFLPGLGTLLPRTYLYTDYAVFLQLLSME